MLSYSEAELRAAMLGVDLPRWAQRPAWQADALCREHPELEFVPRHPAVADVSRQLAVCARCSVRQECLDWALEVGDDFGILGGTTPAQRRAMQRAKGQT